MNVLKLILSAAFVLSIPGWAFTQPASSFTGVWIFDRSMSLYSSDVFRESLTKANSWTEDFLVVQRDPQFSIRRHVVFEAIDKGGKRTKLLEFDNRLDLFTDGRGEENPEPTGRAVFSVTKFAGQKVVSEVYSDADKKGVRTRIGVIEFELSQGGRTLVVSRRGFPESADLNTRQIQPQNRRDFYHLRS